MYAAEWGPENAESQKWDNWSKWVLGSYCWAFPLQDAASRTFGIPPAKLFVGDLTLAAFIVLHRVISSDPWIDALTKGGPLGPCCLAAAGIAGLRHLRSDSRHPARVSLPRRQSENLVFNVYPIYLFLGIWLGRRRPGTSTAICPGLLHLLLLGVYAPAYLALPPHSRQRLDDAGIGWSARSLASRAAAESLSWRCSAWDPKPSRFWAPMTIATGDVACWASTRRMGGHGPGAVDLGHPVTEDAMSQRRYGRRWYRDSSRDRFDVRCQAIPAYCR